MPSFRYLIDMSTLDAETSSLIVKFIETHTMIHSADLSRPWVYSVTLEGSQLSILENPIFRDCRIIRY